MSDERERRLVEPRLAHLLRLDERPEADRADLFSGWRLFFERLSEEAPVILAFEDLQWADSGLLDFVDYLLEWSGEYPIFVLALGRTELRERRSGWQPLMLAPLEPQSIAQVLDGLAPGLPADLVAQIVQRAEGIPLYAVETIRMLQDRGVLAQEGSRYVLKGDVSDLEVPETLHALVASRLDGLSGIERSLLQDASVLGQSFTAASATAVSGMSEAEVKAALDGLVVKQILGRDDDPRSPEQGQYVFLQALLRTVAYGTLPRRARKAKHLAAARHLERTWPGEERDIAEVLASHYQEAIRTEPDADDVGSLRALAREKLTAAGRAAASLALGPEAERYFEQAAELADDDLERAALSELAGKALAQSGDITGAEARLRAAIELYRAAGVPSGGGAAVALPKLLRQVGRMRDARVVLEPFRATVSEGDRVLRAEALAELAAVLIFEGELEDAGPLLEDALRTLEHEQAWPALADALVTRGVYLILTGRRQEGEAVLRHAQTLAEHNDVPTVALRARLNLSQIAIENDRLTQAVDQSMAALALARERGDRPWEKRLQYQVMWPLMVLGRWDEVVSTEGGALAQQEMDTDVLAAALALIASARGDEATLERCRAVAHSERDSTYVDRRVGAELVVAREALEQGLPGEALSLMKRAMSERAISGDPFKEAHATSVEAAIDLGDESALAELEQFVTSLPPARLTPLIRAGHARLRAELAHRAGDEEAAERYRAGSH